MKYRKCAVVQVSRLMIAVGLNLVVSTPLRASPAEAASPIPSSMATVQSAYGHLPLSFEINEGQLDPSVKFFTRGRGHEVYFTPREAVLTLRTDVAAGDRRTEASTQGKSSSNASAPSRSLVRMTFDGGNPHAEVVGLAKLPGIVNYLIGGDPSKWRTNIPTYKEVEYKNLYAGVDLVYYGHQDHLEYDLIVAPGADPTQIRLAFEGAEQIEVDEHGDLVVTLRRSSTDPVRAEAPILRLHKPVVYQRGDDGDKHLLVGEYVLLTYETAPAGPRSAALRLSETSHESALTPHIAFHVTSYDVSKPLIIDPVLSWATYLGGSGGDFGGGEFSESIAVDETGNTYLTGDTRTPGSGFPGTVGSLIQSTHGGGFRDAFVAKINAAGTALVYSTYLGGSGDDYGQGIAVDQAGNAYVTGQTGTPGSGFPGTAGSSIQSTLRGAADAFVAKLNAAGTALVYSTYLGGNELDGGTGIAVDSGGHAYVTGNTSSLGFPGAAHSSIQSTKGGGFFDAFVAKLNAAGTALVYSTYLGGSRDDSGFGIAVDSGGHAYVTGNTSSFGFPGTASSSIQSAFGGGDADAFVAKLNATGTALVYATYLGGSGYDDGRAIVVDQAGQAYVTGATDTPGSGFPGTAGSPIQGSFAGGAVDGYVTKLNAPGTALVYSTYLGGSGNDGGNGIAVDQAGNAYVTGITSTPGSGFPGTADSSIQSTFGGFFDAYVTKLNAAGTALVYSTYLGGSGDDDGEGIAVDPLGNAYVTGTTGTPGSGFPGTVGSLIQNTLAGHTDIFVAKITTNTSPSCSAAQAVPNILWSPNHQFLSIAVHGVTDPDGNPVTITIIGITQDEPVNAKGEGNMSPDAVIQAGSASVRAERAGNGDGRVYQVSFRADDGQGGFCTGAVKVSVPHSLQKGSTAIDDGQVYDSTIP